MDVLTVLIEIGNLSTDYHDNHFYRKTENDSFTKEDLSHTHTHFHS